MSGERTEKATEQRKRKAREKGEIVRSRELNSAVAMLGGLLVLGAAAQQFVHVWGIAYAELLSSQRLFDEPVSACAALLSKAMAPALAPVALVLLAAFAGALITGIAQSGGLQIRANALAIQGSRLNPASNIKQIFSTRSLVRLGKSLLPAAVLVAFSVITVRKVLNNHPVLSVVRLQETFLSGYSLALHAGWLMLGWSALDYLSEYHGWTRRLRMSKQEVREEMRESASNPQVRGRMRQIQRAMAKRRARADIAKASVVIMNPTHFAVALEFSFETLAAPKVLAKGRDLIALQMRDEARWAGVPIVENPPLARSLYRSVDVGQSIPFELYAAVAGVLAYLYRHQVEGARRHSAAGATA